MNMDLYIKKVTKQLHRDLRISSQSLHSMNAIIQYTLQGIMNTANALKTDEKTLTPKTLIACTRLFFEDELANHAVVEGFKSVNNAKKQSSRDSKRKTRESKARIIFSISKVEKMMVKLSLYERKSNLSAVYLATALEYICAEVLEIAGNKTIRAKRKTITPADITSAIVNDPELNKLFANFTTTTIASKRY